MREGQVIDHTKENLVNVVDLIEDKKLKEAFELRLKKRLGLVKDGVSEKEPEAVFPKTYSIGMQFGHFVGPKATAPGCRVRVHNQLLNRSAYENWLVPYINEVLDDNKVLADLVARMKRSFEVS